MKNGNINHGHNNAEHENETGKNQPARYIGSLEEPTIEEVISFLEKYKDTGMKLSVMGITCFNIFSSDNYLIFDEDDLTEDSLDELPGLPGNVIS